MVDDIHKDAQAAQELADKLAPIMFGIKPAVQGNALSILLGVWLAGHLVVDDDQARALKETRELRARLLMLTTNAAIQHCLAQEETKSKPPEPRQ